MSNLFKFPDCPECVNVGNYNVCDECEVGELFEPKQEGALDFDEDRDE